MQRRTVTAYTRVSKYYQVQQQGGVGKRQNPWGVSMAGLSHAMTSTSSVSPKVPRILPAGMRNSHRCVARAIRGSMPAMQGSPESKSGNNHPLDQRGPPHPTSPSRINIVLEVCANIRDWVYSIPKAAQAAASRRKVPEYRCRDQRICEHVSFYVTGNHWLTVFVERLLTAEAMFGNPPRPRRIALRRKPSQSRS
jgi:hypothetical protein